MSGIVVLPAAVRRCTGLGAGTWLEVSEEDEVRTENQAARGPSRAVDARRPIAHFEMSDAPTRLDRLARQPTAASPAASIAHAPGSGTAPATIRLSTDG